MAEAVVSVETQIRDIFRGNAAVTALVDEDCILTQPLKRAGDDDPDLWANDPTPQCFEDVVPHWLRPSISIGNTTPDAGVTGVAEARYLVARVTVAYYAGPDVADVLLWQMRSACMAAVLGQTVTFPDGMGAHLRPINDLSSIVPVPEFPGAGKVMLERVAAFGVWRRS